MLRVRCAFAILFGYSMPHNHGISGLFATVGLVTDTKFLNFLRQLNEFQGLERTCFKLPEPRENEEILLPERLGPIPCKLEI